MVDLLEMRSRMCMQFHYSPFRIKKALGIFRKRQQQPQQQQRRSALGPFPDPKTGAIRSIRRHVSGTSFLCVWCA